MSIYDKKGSQIAVYHAEFADARSCYGGLCEAGATGEETADIPQEVQNAAENYLEAFKKGGAAESTKYAYYPTEELREQHAAQSGQTLENYKIEKIEKLTEYSLCGNIGRRKRNILRIRHRRFSACRKCGWGNGVYIGNTDYVPQDMKEGLDLSHYEYTDPNIL